MMNQDTTTYQEFKGAAVRAEQALEALDQQINFTNDVLADLYARLAIEQARIRSMGKSNGHREC
jgi:hypothetical protein